MELFLGSDGFGYAKNNEEYVKIEQLGKLIIGKNVEIGANCTLDRGAISDTEIHDGVKLDNQIQIAHNVIIRKKFSNCCFMCCCRINCNWKKFSDGWSFWGAWSFKYM